MKTYSAKPKDVQRDWHVVDASKFRLGRLATEIATKLIGKHKPSFTPHIDVGDYVVVTNAAGIKVTGNKLADKTYYRHTGYPGGIRSQSLEELLAKDPTKVIEKAVAGMLPKNKLQAERLKRLKVYPSAEHPHAPQSPKKLEIGDRK